METIKWLGDLIPPTPLQYLIDTHQVTDLVVFLRYAFVNAIKGGKR